MKCPHCGAWNTAYLPKCGRCGTPLDNNTQKQLSWEESMHRKNHSLTVMQFDEEDENMPVPQKEEKQDGAFDPYALDRTGLTDEIEGLKQRREEGSRRIELMKEQASRVRRSLSEAQVVRPLPEEGDSPSAYDSDSIVIRRRQQSRQAYYSAELQDSGMQDDDRAYEEDAYAPSAHQQQYDRYGYFNDPAEQPLTYVDDDEDAPVYYDGYTPESGDQGALTDEEYMPRRIQTRRHDEDELETVNTGKRKKSRLFRFLLGTAIFLLCCALVGVGGLFAARKYIESQGLQMRADSDTRVEVFATTVDGHPAHTLTIYGKENATIYLREMQSSYVVADGKVEVTVPDYMWYDTESSTFATAVETDTMDVTITPFIRYSQEGDQYQLEPIQFTVDVPLSQIYLLNPPTVRADVGVSIYEVRINVEPGSTVIIDGTNVSTLIRETGNVSKNVQVLPVGENTISISVKSKYCRENKMEVTLCREPQEIPLELDATVIVEWNYEAITNEKYASASDEERAKMQRPSIGGTTLPGAIVSVEFPHENLVVDPVTGKFSFNPLFYNLGNNSVPIRASYEGKKDSLITHTVYYMPNADIYTRRAWDLDSQYTDLINYINIRKGTIYMGIGTVERIISTAPQMAVMNIGSATFEKLVMIENSSKTTWAVGEKYRIYGEAYGLYDTMPRLTVRYTYLAE
ncbi:MAG: hypothetical protein IKU73_04550 [Clostridia bacterium]|nr:hypothetical protein [Clostridia bacterium]